jgi:uncharacterized protein YqeY
MLKNDIQKNIILAMKAKDKQTRDANKLIMAKIKQQEVDERISLDEDNNSVLIILTKMIKERNESIKMYLEAKREDLVNKEQFEIDTITGYLPKALSEEEITNIIDSAFEEIKPESLKDMGKIMNIVKPQIQGRADVGKVSGIVKKRIL